MAANPPACRSCGAPLTAVLIDLGMTPISNAFVRADQASFSERFYPLKSFVCDRCWLVQLEDFETPETHFHGEYVYFSSFSDSWLAHARAFVERAIARFALDASSRVVEVGSNDGYLLQYFVQRGIPCLGVDPAANCAKAARDLRRVPTEVAFFGSKAATRLRAEGGAADLIIANNVLAHVPDINDFVAGFKILLSEQGVATFEFPHVLEMIRNVEFDTIYHEHYSYLSLLALEPLFGRHGLQLTDVERLSTHGGSLRLYVAHAGRVVASEAIKQLKQEEIQAGLDRLATYEAFGHRVRQLKRSLLRLLIGLIEEGKSIAAYGAPAKGNTLLNYCGIGRDFIGFTVDRNVHKQGLLLPGTRIPVLAPDEIAKRRPDYVLILPWNLREEIVAQINQIPDWTGRFIIPVPEPLILNSHGNTNDE
ncbi:class I SAM-dependent methyltransferase [Bradyrhizobium murdochi]|uniref:class I SAM-dependent methyltransferase n=1 Tax=Bradyrhizobium murdochi TaxID=1038859 RepID=UPI00054D8BC4|nr:class I SAM-dependent methyltransferase [Bradyrhizobium murdochi]